MGARMAGAFTTIGEERNSRPIIALVEFNRFLWFGCYSFLYLPWSSQVLASKYLGKITFQCYDHLMSRKVERFSKYFVEITIGWKYEV